MMLRKVSGRTASRAMSIIQSPKEPEFEDIMGEAMGDEFAGFISEWAATYYVGQNQLLRHRPELSNYGDEFLA
jgi:hypothetical protein